MAQHSQYTNDPSLTIGKQLHPPSFVGLSSQRIDYPASALAISDQWFETDTGSTYQWNGTEWIPFGDGGGTTNTPTSSFSMATNASLVIAGTLTLGTGISMVIPTGSRLALI